MTEEGDFSTAFNEQQATIAAIAQQLATLREDNAQQQIQLNEMTRQQEDQPDDVKAMITEQRGTIAILTEQLQQLQKENEDQRSKLDKLIQDRTSGEPLQSSTPARTTTQHRDGSGSSTYFGNSSRMANVSNSDFSNFEHRLKYIPSYDGSANDLIFFLECLDKLYTRYCLNNEDNHWSLVQCINTKLKGPAYHAVTQNRSRSIPEIIKTLKTNFADNRNAAQLIDELLNYKYNNKTHPLEFLNQIQGKLVKVQARYELDGITGILLTQLSEQLNKQALKVLTNQLPRQLGLFLLHRNAQTLEEARQMLINDSELLLRDLGFTLDPRIPRKEPQSVESRPSPGRYNDFRRMENNYTRPPGKIFEKQGNFNGYQGDSKYSQFPRNNQQPQRQWQDKSQPPNQFTRNYQPPQRHWQDKPKSSSLIGNVENTSGRTYVVKTKDNFFSEATPIDNDTHDKDHFLEVGSIKDHPPSS